MRATDYAAFSKAAYSEYSTKDLSDRAAAVRKTLDEWGVDKGWHMVGNPLFSNSEFTTFINIESSPHQVVISARGTDPTNIRDLAADVDIATASNQTGDLKRRVQKMVTIARILTGEQQFPHPEENVLVGFPKDGFFKDDIVFTGHSLGGAVAAAAALQYDAKAVVYNMGSSPAQYLNSRPKRNYDNVLHFTTNSVKDGILDPVSVAQYADRAGTGVHTIRYKMPESKQGQSLVQNHSIDSFHRDPADRSMDHYDAVYDEAVHLLRRPYQVSQSETGETGERQYNEPDLAGSAERGRQEAAAERARREAEERAKRQAAAAARAAAEKSHDWSLAHFWGSIAGAVAMTVAAVATVVTGGALGPLAAAAVAGTGILGAASTITTTIGDDIVNYDKKTTGELILDGIGVAAVGAGAAVQGVAVGSRIAGAVSGYQLVQAGVDAAEGVNVGVNAAEAGVNAAEGVEAGVNAAEGVAAGEVELADMAGQEAADLNEFAGMGNEVAPGEDIPMEEFWNNEELAQMEAEQNQGNQAGGNDLAEIQADERQPLLNDPEVDQIGANRNQQQILRDNELMVAKMKQGQKLMAGGRAAIAASEVIGKVREHEDQQDILANRKRRRIGDLDPHNGSGNTPSHAPGSHMDESERMRFVSDETTNERSLGYNNNKTEVDDVPSKLLQFVHKSLMAGKGVDITTQIPMVTAARGNYLRHLAEVSAMF